MQLRLLLGECADRMSKMAEGSVDVIVCDPPYGLAFMGREWDSLGKGASQRLWHKDWVEAAFRVLRPGGVLKAFNGTRTMHHMAMAMEIAGFSEIGFDAWGYGSGFPKSHSISKAIDKMAYKRREELLKEALLAKGFASVVWSSDRV